MFCAKCGTEIIEEHSFCGKCGTPATDFAKALSEAPKKRAIGPIGYSALALLAFLIVMFFIAQSQKTPNSSSDPAVEMARLKVPIIRHESQVLLSGSHVVQPQQYVTYTISISPEMRNARLSGRFTATGGAGNDLQALITDEDGLMNFKNGHQAKVYYESGKVTADSFDVRLEPGTYYLVFNNGFSLVSNKAYDADVKLDFDHTVIP